MELQYLQQWLEQLASCRRYLTRDVDPQQPIAPMPAPVAALLPRLLAAGGTDRLDQLTVNEYGVGVGLSPHIDTHSSFTGAATRIRSQHMAPQGMACQGLPVHDATYKGLLPVQKGAYAWLALPEATCRGSCESSFVQVIDFLPLGQAPSCRCRWRARR